MSGYHGNSQSHQVFIYLSVPLYSILFYCLFYSILYSILFYSILFYSILFYSILFYTLFYSILYSILFLTIPPNFSTSSIIFKASLYNSVVSDSIAYEPAQGSIIL